MKKVLFGGLPFPQVFFFNLANPNINLVLVLTMYQILRLQIFEVLDAAVKAKNNANL